MEFEYEDRMEMIKVIDSYLDIANYEHSRRNYVLNKSGLVIPNVTVNKDWHEIHALINEELREKGFFSDRHTLFIHFDAYTGKIESIYIELEIPHETEETHDEYEVGDCEIKITKKDSFVISKKTELRFDFSPSEWKNFKRTELMDRMLNEKVLCKKSIYYENQFHPGLNGYSFLEGNLYLIVNHYQQGEKGEGYWVETELFNRNQERFPGRMTTGFFATDDEFSRKHKAYGYIHYIGDYFFLPNETSNIIRTNLIDKILNKEKFSLSL